MLDGPLSAVVTGLGQLFHTLRTFAYDPVISFVFYMDGAEVDA